MAESVYTSLSRPYDYYLDRGNGNTPLPSFNPAGNLESKPVKDDGSMGDIWLNTFIASTNWSPKKTGFYIDGQKGYAEFQNVYISGDIHASTGEIGGFLIGYDYIEDVADTFGLASSTLLPYGQNVRFWAGGTFANRAIAPLRIFDNGDIIVLTEGDVEPADDDQ